MSLPAEAATPRAATALPLLAVVLAALVLRLIAVFTLSGLAPETNDQVQRYDRLALSAVAPEERAEVFRPRQKEDHSDRSDKIELDRFFYRVALEQIRDEPGVFLGGIGGRLVQMWSRTHSGRFQSWLLLANGALLSVAATGTLLARARWPLLPLLGVFAYYVALHTVMFAMFRYLLPVIPALLVLAAVPLAVTLDRRHGSAIGEQSPST